jgi:hypothetical protein
MMDLLLLIAVASGLVLAALFRLYYNRTEAGRRTMAKYSSREYQESFRRTNPDYNPETGEWEDWDGTPYGAIDGLFMDTDGDGGLG